MWWKAGSGSMLLPRERGRGVRELRSKGRIDRGQKWSHDRSAGPNLRPLSCSAEVFRMGEGGGEGAASGPAEARRFCPSSSTRSVADPPNAVCGAGPEGNCMLFSLETTCKSEMLANLLCIR